MSAVPTSVRNGYRRFLKGWLEDPFAVGALAPSGRPLAKLLTRELQAGDRVIELGPGTGTVTREILARGVRPSDLFLIERSKSFADRLEADFPGVSVLQGDATEPQAEFNHYRGAFDFVISGLPLVLFSRQQKARLLQTYFDLLTPSGAVCQFTYGGRCPVDRRELERQGLQSRCTGFIALNMPPAFVYCISRRRGADGKTQR